MGNSPDNHQLLGGIAAGAIDFSLCGTGHGRHAQEVKWHMAATSDEVRQLLDTMVARLVKEYRPEKVILFGSYAYGDPGPESDIDLLIVKETPERFLDRLTTVRRIVSDPKRKLPLDVLVLTPEEISQRLAIGDHYIEDIVAKGEVLYAS